MKERYGSVELQPDEGWTIVRSNRPDALSSTVLDDVGMAMAVEGMVIDVDDANDDDGVDADALVSETSPLDFLCSIDLPMNPPATPAIVVRSNPRSRSRGQRLVVPR